MAFHPPTREVKGVSGKTKCLKRVSWQISSHEGRPDLHVPAYLQLPRMEPLEVADKRQSRVNWRSVPKHLAESFEYVSTPHPSAQNQNGLDMVSRSAQQKEKTEKSQPASSGEIQHIKQRDECPLCGEFLRIGKGALEEHHRCVHSGIVKSLLNFCPYSYHFCQLL